MKAAVALDDAQTGHRKGDRLAPHDPAAVAVDGKLAGWSLVLADGFLSELLAGSAPSR
jgi:hypothetical protein